MKVVIKAISLVASVSGKPSVNTNPKTTIATYVKKDPTLLMNPPRNSAEKFQFFRSVRELVFFAADMSS